MSTLARKDSRLGSSLPRRSHPRRPSAPFGLACFVGAMGFMEGRNVQDVQTKFHEASGGCAPETPCAK